MHLRDNPYPEAGIQRLEIKSKKISLIFTDHLACTKLCARCYEKYKNGSGTVSMFKRLKIYKVSQIRFMATQAKGDATSG